MTQELFIIDDLVIIGYNIHNITATLSTRKGVAQPWRFFFARYSWLS